MKRLSKLVWWINIILALVTLLSYLAPYINPQNIWQFSFLGLAYPTLLLLNIIFIAIWSIARKKKLLLSLGIILLGLSPLRSHFAMSLTGSTANQANDIKMLSYNTHAFLTIRNEKSKTKKKTLEDKFKNFLVSTQSNIICLQECGNRFEYILSDSTKFNDFHKIFTNTGTILSKWPIINHEADNFKKSSNGYVFADIKKGRDTIRVINIHLQSNSVSQRAEKVLESDLQKRKTWSEIKTLLAQVNYYTLQRVGQAEFVAKMIKDSPYPVLLAGDFNNTPQSYAYKLITTNMSDSFREKGWGLGTTYAGKIPGLRIDFILNDKHFDVIDSEVVHFEFSDHYPVLSSFIRRP